MTAEENITILETHLANLSGALTFKDYQKAHCEYVRLLLDEMKARAGVKMTWGLYTKPKTDEPETP
jgi:hypothetical protein